MNAVDEVLPAEDLVADDAQIGAFAIVDGDPDAAVLRQELAQELQAGIHHVEPGRMFEVVVVVFEGGAGVVGGIDVDALHLASVERQQRLQRLQVVAVDEQVVARPIRQRPILAQDLHRAVLRRPAGLLIAHPLQHRHIVFSFKGDRDERAEKDCNISPTLCLHRSIFVRAVPWKIGHALRRREGRATPTRGLYQITENRAVSPFDHGTHRNALRAARKAVSKIRFARNDRNPPTTQFGEWIPRTAKLMSGAKRFFRITFPCPAKRVSAFSVVSTPYRPTESIRGHAACRSVDDAVKA